MAVSEAASDLVAASPDSAGAGDADDEGVEGRAETRRDGAEIGPPWLVSGVGREQETVLATNKSDRR